MIGTRLGQYEIVEELGRGGMATVYRAYHPTTERFVAIKIIHKAITSDADAMERFRREARLISRLENPHLLPIYDYNVDHDPPYIVMRYLEGGSLKDIINQRVVLPLGEVAHLFRQICTALEYAHKQNIVHRDIKPGNIMVDADGNAFVTDFGIARVGDFTAVTQTGFTVGTPGYMSPEQGMGEKDIDARADIYSLGVMAFEMAVGDAPYKAETPMGVLLQHMQNPLPSARAVNHDLPPEFDLIIQKAMAKKKEDRYSSAMEFSNAITELAGSQATSAEPIRLKTTAKQVALKIQQNRNGALINTLMDGFSASRSRIAVMPDVPTTKTPSGQLPVGTSIGNPLPSSTMITPPKSTAPFLLGIGFAIVIVAIGIGLFVVKSNNDATLQTQTAVAQLAVEQAQTATAQLAAEQARTATAQMVAEQTQTATAQQLMTGAIVITDVLATDTPLPTNTEKPPTATPIVPFLEAKRDLEVRAGADSEYATIGQLSKTEQLDIVGKNEDGSWYQVRLPNGRFGWIPASASFVTTAGNVEALKVAIAPSITPSPTYTVTPSTTPSVTPSITPSVTPSETPSATKTDTPTPEPTATYTATASATPEPTATFTPSLTPTPEPTATVTETASPTLTFTPQPIGQIPYLANFDNASVLMASDYDPLAWQIDPTSNTLESLARLSQPFILLGKEQPEWVNNPNDFVLTFRAQMSSDNAVVRLVYRYDENAQSYYVLEVSPGTYRFKRSNESAKNPLTDRLNEKQIGLDIANPIQAGEWRNITLWSQGNRITVYLDGEFAFTRIDTISPRVSPSGKILFQSVDVPSVIRLDDVAILRALPVSEHFEDTAIVPSAWIINDLRAVTLKAEDDATRSLRFNGNGDARLDTAPLADFDMYFRLYNEEGGMQLFLRETAEGEAIRVSFSGGSITVESLDAQGNASFVESYPDFYAYIRWQGVVVQMRGNTLKIIRDNRIREFFIPNAPALGTIRFAGIGNKDRFRLDDVLLFSVQPQ